ncbi:MAG: sterol desaturase family protein [Actinomycetota bacterium]
MLDNLEITASLLESILIPLLLIELVVLRRQQRLRWPRLKEMLANGTTYLLYLAAGLVGVIVWTRVFDVVEGAVPWSIPTAWWSVPIAIVVADFIYWWQHKLAHEKRLLWDLYHSVHHSSERFDQTTSLRLGIFDALLTIVFTLPMIVVGFSSGLALASTALVLGYQTWIHTEVIDKMPRWFEAIFNTPSHHRAHHGAEEPYLDVNYGGILIIWDRLFGTFQPELDTPIYGLTTQIESSNPIDIQFFELRRLIRDLRADADWSTRWARLWNPPGWQLPDDAAPSQTA